MILHWGGGAISRKGTLRVSLQDLGPVSNSIKIKRHDGAGLEGEASWSDWGMPPISHVKHPDCNIVKEDSGKVYIM